jgi:hypothetical protein
MHDTWAQWGTISSKRHAKVHQSVHQSSPLERGDRMHGHSGSFIEHEEMVVLVEDVEGEFFGKDEKLAPLGPGDFQKVSGTHQGTGFPQGDSVTGNAPLFHHAGKKGPGEVGKVLSKPHINPLEALINQDFFFPHGGENPRQSL